MRQPLTRQNSTRVKRRYSAYQNRIFFYLVTLVTAPLLLLGVLSSVVYYRQTVTRSDALLASARENVATQMEIALSNLRAYYSAVVSADNYQTLCQKTVPPYSEYTLVRDMQTAMRGMAEQLLQPAVLPVLLLCRRYGFCQCAAAAERQAYHVDGRRFHYAELRPRR